MQQKNELVRERVRLRDKHEKGGEHYCDAPRVGTDTKGGVWREILRSVCCSQKKEEKQPLVFCSLVCSCRKRLDFGAFIAGADEIGRSGISGARRGRELHEYSNLFEIVFCKAK